MPGGDPPRAAEEIPAHEAAEKTFPFLNDWELVMLVSFTEAYLEDLLILLVQKNPLWMQQSTQSISYAELLGATSIPDIIGRMQRRWAKMNISLQTLLTRSTPIQRRWNRYWAHSAVARS
jgi:hypothetical protein